MIAYAFPNSTRLIIGMVYNSALKAIKDYYSDLYIINLFDRLNIDRCLKYKERRP